MKNILYRSLYILGRTVMTLGPLSLLLFMLLYWPTLAMGAGTLAPVNGYPPLQIQNHHVEVTINNGFAIAQVSQTFSNPYDSTLEAIYTFPAPLDATLANVEIMTGETILRGEVVARQKAREVYKEETAAGNDAGLAEADHSRQFRFHVYPVAPGAKVSVTFTYYQPVRIDAGIGRFVYPLEEGGTDTAAESFWTRNSRVDGQFSIEVDILSAFPLADVRAPGLEAHAQIEQPAEAHWRLSYTSEGGQLNRDFVAYYRLQDNLPGRVELIPYRASSDTIGTFMLVVTPGLDLKPLSGGVDYLFVLDVSGSMESKLQTLVKGVGMAIGQLRQQDRFRVVTFNNGANDLTGGWRNATPDAVNRTLRTMASLRSGGGTNLEQGVIKALRGVDEDRVTSMVLVTDGVANLGNVSPAYFHQLLRQYDLRLFGFLMGNNANSPMMETLCDATGGYFNQVSNQDDIIGQIMMAKGKVTHEALHDVVLELESSEVTIGGLTGDSMGKVFLGQQLVLFGQYEGSGDAMLRLKMRISGENRVVETPLRFPEVDQSNPELERLWAIQTVQDAQFNADLGVVPQAETDSIIQDIGIRYQIVTDETSMVILSDEGHARHGIDRQNLQRVANERQAQAARAVQAPQNHTQASGGALGNRSTGDSVLGGGAISPVSALLIVTGLLGCIKPSRRRTR